MSQDYGDDFLSASQEFSCGDSEDLVNSQQIQDSEDTEVGHIKICSVFTLYRQKLLKINIDGWYVVRSTFAEQ